MRVRIIKHLISIYGSMEPGTVHEIPDAKAESWCRAGIAMQDKSLDGARETKVGAPSKRKQKTRR